MQIFIQPTSRLHTRQQLILTHYQRGVETEDVGGDGVQYEGGGDR